MHRLADLAKGQSPVVPAREFKKRQEVDPAWPPVRARHAQDKPGSHAADVRCACAMLGPPRYDVVIARAALS